MNRKTGIFDIAFVIVLEENPPNANFSIKDLPSASKIDVIARCLLNLFPNTIEGINITFYGLFSKSSIRYFTIHNLPDTNHEYDEIEIASLIKESLNSEIGDKASDKALIKWAHQDDFQSFIQLITKKYNSTFYLHEEGILFDHIDPISLTTNSCCFILGGRQDISQKHEKIIDEFNIQHISLGLKSYLASFCLTSILYKFEKFQKDYMK
ncbi:MAG: hypothetical protein FK734_18025 [Asgard group archaeon]|nr:hypothetical protein [Asgard group archaeon]